MMMDFGVGGTYSVNKSDRDYFQGPLHVETALEYARHIAAPEKLSRVHRQNHSINSAHKHRVSACDA